MCINSAIDLKLSTDTLFMVKNSRMVKNSKRIIFYDVINSKNYEIPDKSLNINDLKLDVEVLFLI